MPSTELSGVKIVYDDLGRGEPAVLFLSGWCAPRSVFQPLLPAESQHRRALAVDWRGHGESATPSGDFGQMDLVDDAEAVINASNAGSVVVVALAHAGWVAIELRKRLGQRIRGLVLLEWFVLGAPPQFREVLHDMGLPDRWRQAVDSIFDRWLYGVNDPALIRFVRKDMGAFGFEMWARAAREISAAFDRNPVPLNELASLGLPVMHLYSQPKDDTLLLAQQEFARSHPWFSVERLQADSHFPMFEVPNQIVELIERFIAGFNSESISP
jgi:pimeloyl-ACP methyl ester carboxylesterase